MTDAEKMIIVQKVVQSPVNRTVMVTVTRVALTLGDTLRILTKLPSNTCNIKWSVENQVLPEV